jgi:hypothetical protein
VHNSPQWDVEIDRVADPGSVTVEVGDRWPVRFSPFLGEPEGTLTVAEVALGARLVLEADFAGMRTTITYLYGRENSGTRFTRRVDVRLAGMVKMMTPFVARRIKHANRRDVANLKRVLEAA